MPRVGRMVLANCPQHVVQRGHGRQVLFAAAEDYRCDLPVFPVQSPRGKS
jgi:hypothetical protein